MKITEPKNTFVTFDSLVEGDVFTRNGNYEYYMKTEFIRGDDEWYNCVCLSNGKLFGFMAYDNVCKIDCELIIH